MGYSSEFGKNAASGGPWPDAPKGNTKRPQDYYGNYTTTIPGRLSRPSDDGKEHPGIAPQQGFRKELPPIRTGSEVVEDFEPAEKLTIDDVYAKSKKSFGWR